MTGLVMAGARRRSLRLRPPNFRLSEEALSRQETQGAGMVGATGIEPVTPSMSTRCSPAELRALRP